ncbi:MAG: tetratricopeptide repeat protein [Thermoanaerobaculia bacterium]|nr:tetratricopeptide repeat protein [Thermoanaerobaculia bacterium]
MAEETSALAEVTLTPEAEHEWELLRELVDFADRLAVAFIFADRFAVRVLRARMQREAHEHGMPFRFVTCDTPDALRESALAAILTPATEHEVTWLEAFGSEEELRGAWFFAAQRWNEHREPLRRSTLRALIVAAPPWAKPVIRLAAPDLWSITNLVIEPTALPLATTLGLSTPAVHYEGTPAERALATRVIEEVLAAPERIPWAFIDAINEAVRAGALHAADRAAEDLDLSTEALERLVNEPGFADKPSVTFRASIAKELSSLSVSLSELGRSQDALKTAARAAELYRELALEQPKTFLPNLAMSLHNLGVRFSELGLHREALEVTEQAVDTFRQLVDAQAEPFEVKLAWTLSTLGNRLSELGHHDEALNAAREAVAIFRRLADPTTAPASPDLAAALANLGNRLNELGRHEEALEAAREAVSLFRRLAPDQPALTQHKLAGSLNNLGSILNQLGRREEAVVSGEEAVNMIARLARLKPRVFLPTLSLFSQNLRDWLAKSQRSPNRALRCVMPRRCSRRHDRSWRA